MALAFSWRVCFQTSWHFLSATADLFVTSWPDGLRSVWRSASLLRSLEIKGSEVRNVTCPEPLPMALLRRSFRLRSLQAAVRRFGRLTGHTSGRYPFTLLLAILPGV